MAPPPAASAISTTTTEIASEPVAATCRPRSADQQLPTTTIPQRTRDRILSGEFLDLSELLVDPVGLAPNPSSTGVQMHLMDGTPVRLTQEFSPKASTWRHVCDLATWLEAWTVVLHTILQAAPERASELVGYQAIITEANRKFVPDGWLEYDRQFRRAAASNPARRWDVIDHNIWQLSTTGKARTPCFACSLVHPPSAGGQCPFRPSRATPFGGAHSSPSVGGHPICRNFNWARCQGGCGRAHLCLQCQGRHPKRPALPTPRAHGPAYQRHLPNGQASKSPVPGPDTSMAGRHATSLAPAKQACTDSNSNSQFPPLAFPALDSSMPCIHTPIDVARFTRLLADHPDKAFSSRVSRGLQSGFRIGFSGRRQTVTAPNLPSSAEHSVYISEYLATSCAQGETCGPYSTPPFPSFQCSGIGVVPKKNGKLRIIHHLSAPVGNSVNDGIDPSAFSLSYIRIDDAVQTIMAYGQGALLTKLDIRNAFRLIPVHPSDWSLLGIQWQGQYYFDRVLPFGLRSSPFLFDQVASAIEWIITTNFAIPHLLHYLDDFLSISPPQRSLAIQAKNVILQAFKYLSIPLAEEKLEGPSTSLVFLGIVLDMVRMEAHLPDDKLADLRELLSEMSRCTQTTQRKLDHFLGKLSFASSVVVPGRTFTRRLWDINKRFSHAKPYFRITLTGEARKDIRWWQLLIQHWNGKAFLLYNSSTSSADLGLYTDANGTLGWRAFYGKEQRWIQGRWAKEQEEESIGYKELYAVAMACSTWGNLWSRQRIVMHCDNQSVVECLKSNSSKSPGMMSLLRALFFVCATHSFTITAK